MNRFISASLRLDLFIHRSTPLSCYAIACPLTLLANWHSFTDQASSSWIFRERPTRASNRSCILLFLLLENARVHRRTDVVYRASNACSVYTRALAASQRFDLPPVSIVANAGTRPATDHLGSSQSLPRPRGRRECSLSFSEDVIVLLCFLFARPYSYLSFERWCFGNLCTVYAVIE